MQMDKKDNMDKMDREIFVRRIGCVDRRLVDDVRKMSGLKSRIVG